MRFDKKQQASLMANSQKFLNSNTIADKSDYIRLIEVLHFHEWKYYVMNDPALGDTQYDALFNLLKATEEAKPSWIRSDSPTQRVGSDLSDDFPTVRHLSSMLSLPNSYNGDDLKAFDKSIKKLTKREGDIEYVVEPKFDGGTIVIVYENDYLQRAATRGNGSEGDEITNNIKTIRSIPLSAPLLNAGLSKVEIRGEAVIAKEKFLQMNIEREKNNEVLFANPRNTATGGLRTKNPRETEARNIQAFIFQISYAEGEGNSDLKTHYQSLQLLHHAGFKVPINEAKLCKNIDEVIEYCAEWEAKRDSYSYEIDGMVVKVNDFELQRIAGETSHHPRWAMAYKFKAKQATTFLEQVVYQVGKIGTITPVAKVQPVALAGVTVSSISLHNEDFINQKDLRLGDPILIERAGDVIPYIVKSFPDLRKGTEEIISFPENCPINTDESQPVKLIRDENEAAWRCPNCVCGAQDLQRMIFFVSKDAMNIDGMGKSIIEKFHSLGWLKNIADIYKLDYNAISELEGFGKKSARKLEKAIEKSRSNPMYRLLYSLSIHHLGQRAAKILSVEVEHVMELKNWTHDQLTALKDIGPVLANNVVEWFSDEKNITLLTLLEDRGVNLNQTEADRPVVVEQGPLVGKTILFTGTLENMSRKEAQQLAESMGAKNISTVSKNLDILVAGAKAGSKLKKAEALGSVQIMTEDEFLQLNS